MPFSNKYIRSTPLEAPILSLNAYLQISAFAYLIVTAWLLFFKNEEEEPTDKPDMNLWAVYEVMFRICRLKHVQTFIIIHLIAKIGFQANDAVTGLKLVEKGFGKEDLALTVLIDFPFQLILGYLAARWSQGKNALRPWLFGYVARLGFAIISMAIVAGFPKGDDGGKSVISTAYFSLITVVTVTASFASTVQFVGISAFHTQIADPLIGGTYMTLLNTVSNLGGTWPRPLVLKAVDYFTISSCSIASSSKEAISSAASNALTLASNECTSDEGAARCRAVGGTCIIERDGYYWTSTICVVIGTIALFTFILPKAQKLQRLPAAAWRVSLDTSKHSHAH
jgi:PAT family acetyl-CoA transporter-like MFS transporter 1